MDNYVGKTCPFCKTEITEGDAVNVCAICGSVQHLKCWNENPVCPECGCSEQDYKVKTEDVLTVCSGCGNVLQEGQRFCNTCGKSVDAAANTGIRHVDNKYPVETKPAKKKKKTGLIIGGIAAAVVAIGAVLGVVLIVAILVIALLLGGMKKDFNDMYSDIQYESWCTIASDGSYMKLDTNPYNYDDELIFEAWYKIQDVNEELGFSSVLSSKMEETTALDGRQTEENEDYKVSWKYHPDSGLEVTYEMKD